MRRGTSASRLALDLDLDQQPFLAAVAEIDLDQVVRETPAQLGVLDRLGQFLVQEFEAPRPVDLGGDLGEEEGHEVLEIVLQDLLPGAVVVVGHRVHGMSRLREQVQARRHLDPNDAAQVPLARSTWSDAVAAPTRSAALAATLPALVADARAILPDRLRAIPGLGARPVRAIDSGWGEASVRATRKDPEPGRHPTPDADRICTIRIEYALG